MVSTNRAKDSKPVRRRLFAAMATLAVAAALAQAVVSRITSAFLGEELAMVGGLAAAFAVAVCGAWVLARLDANARLQLVERATHDGLTGLANRDYFFVRAQDAIGMTHRGGARLALIFLDVDGFKAVNDRFGHAVGDAVLCGIARRLPPLLRAGDLAARVGGDEFALLVNMVFAADDVAMVRARVADAMRAAIPIEGGEVPIRLSCGVAFFPDDGADASTLLAVADDRMYADKAAHGAATTVAAPATNQSPPATA